ncbi:hypothetical protein OIU78_012193 [Salix suchowensis]|nr:hypothetical protein OIU78_012193 [Salix suchowensis]
MGREEREKKGLALGFWRRGEARVLEEMDLERKRRQAMENDFWRRWIWRGRGAKPWKMIFGGSLDLTAVILGAGGSENFMEIQKYPTCRIRTSDLRMATRLFTHYSPPLYQLS